MTFEQIQETLFENYYSSEEFSEVTSSHWVNFGNRVKVARDRTGFDFDSFGISSYREKSFLPTLKHLPIDILLSQMLLKYGAKKKTVRAAKTITKQLKIYFDFDHAKHILIYDLLNAHGLLDTPHLICIIGDGHAFMGMLIKRMCPNAKILFINLGRNLLIDAIVFSRVFTDVRPFLFQKPVDCYLLDKYSVVFLEAERFALMQKLPISLYINVASMQEMNTPVIERYFEYMQTSTVPAHFYCCNREEKKLPDGTIIRFEDYPWGGEVLLDELCPWYQHYPSVHPPFWQPFDGPHRHRLVKFNINKGV